MDIESSLRRLASRCASSLLLAASAAESPAAVLPPRIRFELGSVSQRLRFGTKRSAYVKFTDEMEEALSPQRHIARVNAPIVLVYGSFETPEFQRQSRDFADALTRAGKSCELMRAEGYNHFEIAETLGNPYGPAGRALLAQLKLNSGSVPDF